jgi:hypothetical protein
MDMAIPMRYLQVILTADAVSEYIDENCKVDFWQAINIERHVVK